VAWSWFVGDAWPKRLAALWLAGIALNLLAWEIGFAVLPEHALRGVFPGAGLSTGNGAAQAALRILLYNVLAGGGLIVLANLFRVRSLPLGYVPAAYHWTLYGLLLGTNSFAVDRGARLAPSLPGLVAGSGFLEISAYTLVAAATAGIYLWRQEKLLTLTADRVRGLRDVRLRRGEWALLAVALGLLVVANVREARGLPAASGLHPRQGPTGALAEVGQPRRVLPQQAFHRGDGRLELRVPAGHVVVGRDVDLDVRFGAEVL
jgi:hypothetical protein